MAVRSKGAAKITMNNNSIKKSVGIKDVAKYANVSISTVSNVLNSTKAVSPALQERVMDAVHALNYEVNAVARGLKSGRTNTIAIIVPSITSIYFPSILESIQAAADEKGYMVNVFGTEWSLKREKHYIQALKSQWIDGILLSSALDTDSARAGEYISFLSTLNRNGNPIPVVCFEAAISKDLDAVIVNDMEGIRMAAEHLISQGRTKIAYIAAPTNFYMGKQRLKGYKNALTSHGLPVRKNLIMNGDYSPRAGYECMKSLLESDTEIDAVVTGNDQMGIGAIRAVLDSGLRIPEDIAVIGFNDNFPSSLISPSLSTVKVPKTEMGTMAFDLLLKRLKTPTLPRTLIRLDGQLVVRKSTDKNAEDKWVLDW